MSNLYALQFDGGNYVNVGTLGTFGANHGNPFKIEFYVKTTQSNAAFLFGLYGGTVNDQVFYAKINHAISGDLRFTLRDTSMYRLYGNTGNIGLNDGFWHKIEIEVTTSTNTIVVKLDGDSKAISYDYQQNLSDFGNLTEDMFLASYNHLSSQPGLIGKLDEVKIIENYGEVDEAVVGYWRFEEGAGLTTADESGNGNTGSLEDSPIWTDDTPSLGGEDLIKVINEALNISEPINKFMQLSRVKTESLNITEVKNKNQNKFRTITETLNINELVNITRGRFKVITENLNISELKNKTQFKFKIVTENLQINELISKSKQIFKIISEKINLSEKFTKISIREIIKIITENLNIVETKHRSLDFIRIITERLNLGEKIKRSGFNFIRIINEKIQISENIGAILSHIVEVLRKNSLITLNLAKNSLITINKSFKSLITTIISRKSKI